MFFRVQTRILAASFEPLNSCLAFAVPELLVLKIMCNPVVLAQKSLRAAGCNSNVNMLKGLLTNCLA